MFVIRWVYTGEGPGEYWDLGKFLSMELWGKPIPRNSSGVFAPVQQRGPNDFELFGRRNITDK